MNHLIFKLVFFTFLTHTIYGCSDINASCGQELKNWEMCKDTWWNSQCQKTCCECGCPDDYKCVNYVDDQQCSNYLGHGKCGTDTWITYVCQKTCNACEVGPCGACTESTTEPDPDTNTDTDTGTDTEETTDDENTPSKPQCIDLRDDCESNSKNWDMCKDTWWKTQCQKTCCDCGCPETELPCEDFASQSQCLDNKSWGNCKTSAYAQYVCQKTCGTCSMSSCHSCMAEPDPNEVEECVDFESNCSDLLKQFDMCAQPWFQSRCPKTCCQCECPSSSPCEDYLDSADCANKKLINQCETDLNVKYKCQKTCGTCSVNACAKCGGDIPETCEDIDSDCASELLEWDICKDTSKRSKCKKTCCDCDCDSFECKDFASDSFCSNEVSLGENGCQGDLIRYRCQKSCNSCSMSACYKCGSDTDDSTDTDDTTPPVCEDSHSDCLKELVFSDICSDSYWRDQCKKTCCDCECPDDVYCLDYMTKDQCGEAKKEGLCNTSEYFKYLCQSTCQTCQKNACYKCTQSPNTSSLQNPQDLPDFIQTAINDKLCK